MRSYQPLVVPAETSVAQRWERLQRLAAEESWALETFDQSSGVMIGSRRTGGSEEVREHLRVVLRPSLTEISVRTQVLDDGEWDAREITCGRYEYSRETEIAMKLDLTRPLSGPATSGTSTSAAPVGTTARRP